MEIFPAQYSTLSAKALKKEIENYFGWEKVKCRLLLHGVNDTYLLESSNGKNIFRIYRSNHRSLDEIRGEIELLLILQKKGRKVAAPLKDKAGNYLQEFAAPEGTRYGVMFAYAPGKSINDLSDAQYAMIGKEMAAMHNVTSGLRLSFQRKRYDLDTMLREPLKKLRPAFKELPEEYKLLKKTVREVEERLAGVDVSKFSYGVCHYDMIPKNIHFSEDNDLCVFDLDFAGEGWLVNDIAAFHSHLYWRKKYDPQNAYDVNAETSFTAFLNAYRSVRPLSEEEMQVIPHVGFCWWMFYLGFLYESFDDFSSLFFNEKFMRGRVAWMKEYFDTYKRS